VANVCKEFLDGGDQLFSFPWTPLIYAYGFLHSKVQILASLSIQTAALPRTSSIKLGNLYVKKAVLLSPHLQGSGPPINRLQLAINCRHVISS